MKILHVASFVGNIGDNASHAGLYRLLEPLLPAYDVERMEIRKFYKNYHGPDRMFFDQDFVDLANTFDLVIIGGGGFLDYWVPESASGTTIDMPPHLVSRIRVPTLITSVGCQPQKEIPAGNLERFRSFLDAALQNEKIRIAVRNDGSINVLRSEVGESYAKSTVEIADNGFFYQVTHDAAGFRPKRPYVAVNIVTDQLLMISNVRSKVDEAIYYRELKHVIENLINDRGLDVVLVPHIHSDLSAIANLLGYLDDFLVREHVSVAPLVQHDWGADYVFSIYRNSELVIGTRFHANVCPLGMGVFCVGLVALDRVKYLYDQFGVSERYVILDQEFAPILQYKIGRMLDGQEREEDQLIQKSMKTLKERSEAFYRHALRDLSVH